MGLHFTKPGVLSAVFAECNKHIGNKYHRSR
jgi:hypothetical protein